jgi:signal transduction histidine kinase
LRRVDRATLIVEVSSQRLADGRILYIVCDVTESKRLESAVRLLAQSGPQANPDVFCASCVAELASAFGVGHASIGLLEHDAAQVRIVSRWPAVNESPPASYAIATSPCGRLGTAQRSLQLLNAARDFPGHTLFGGSPVAGYLGAAIVAPSGSLTGVIELWDEQPFVAGPESLRILEMFAHRIGAEIERASREAQLTQLTTTLEAKVEERTASLAQANRELEAFSYTVSHDLRAPVRAIDAHASMLLEESLENPDGPARRYAQRILQAAHRMRELIEGLLTIARISHQPQSLEAVDLSVLAMLAIEQLRERDSGRKVDFICAPDLKVHADRTAASIVITNLIENSWKYSARVAEARIQFGCERQNDEVVFFVRDNGAGFDMQHARRLFKPFARLHDSSEYPGSGVGLATVERIVQRHEGRVWADSAPSAGATFYFTFGPCLAGRSR